MTSEDIQSELEREPFRPFRIHLVSGKEFVVNSPNDAHMLRDAIMVFERRKPRSEWPDKYHVFDLMNIERVEILPSNGKHKRKKRQQERPNHD
jgi:hypothetical protein